jgi:hypothetical protein
MGVLLDAVASGVDQWRDRGLVAVYERQCGHSGSAFDVTMAS